MRPSVQRKTACRPRRIRSRAGQPGDVPRPMTVEYCRLRADIALIGIEQAAQAQPFCGHT
ncbi:hypothetical protein EYW47_33295 [Paraburkholderia silviterrae]|uniref:Uncharacterized protein n=1 Tax=Paraburkholderia silviterrae TaxID=2528715 RepID=A0A4R5M0V8_9BURK|nr:hypothetical protein EYW47_33295 [Paraburkholderia silviterrae]